MTDDPQVNGAAADHPAGEEAGVRDSLDKLRPRLIGGLAIGVAVYLGFAVYADWGKLREVIWRFDWRVAPLLLLLSSVNYFIRFGKWNYYLHLLDIRPPVRVSFPVFLAGFSMTITPGKMGELLKSYLLRRSHGTPMARSAPTVLAERITDFLALLILAVVGAVLYNYGLAVLAPVMVVIAAFVLLIGSESLMHRVLAQFERFERLKPLAAKAEEAYRATAALHRIKPLIITTLVSIVSWGLECFGFYLVFLGFGVQQVDLMGATFIFSFSTIVGTASMIPGGLGATEALMTGLLHLIDVPTAEAVAATLIIRAATLWYAVVVGVATLFVFRRRLTGGK